MNVNLSKRATKWLAGLVTGSIAISFTVGMILAPHADEKTPSEMMEFEIQIPELPQEIKNQLEQQDKMPHEKQQDEFEGDFI